MQLALLHYGGGGDWYNDVNSLHNLAKFCNQNLGTDFNLQYATVESGSADIFNYPFVYMTGHGNFDFTPQEAANMRKFLIGGGFLIINDSYGLNKYVRPAMKKIFPELDFLEVPFNHPIYHQKYDFQHGPPKIHVHDSLPAQGFGLFYQGRLVCYYDYQCDLGDGWDDIYNDPEDIRQKALEMGANLVQYVFTQNGNM